MGWAEPWSVEQRINCLKLMMKYALGRGRHRVHVCRQWLIISAYSLLCYKHNTLEHRREHSHTDTAIITLASSHYKPHPVAHSFLGIGLNRCSAQQIFPECQCSPTFKYSTAVLLVAWVLCVCVAAPTLACKSPDVSCHGSTGCSKRAELNV